MAKKSGRRKNEKVHVEVKVENNLNSKNRRLFRDFRGDSDDENDNSRYLIPSTYGLANNDYLNTQLWNIRDMLSNNMNLGPREIDMMANNKQQNVENMSSKILPDTTKQDRQKRNKKVADKYEDFINNFKVKEEPEETIKKEDDDDDDDDREYSLFFPLY